MVIVVSCPATTNPQTSEVSWPSLTPPVSSAASSRLLTRSSPGFFRRSTTSWYPNSPNSRIAATISSTE